MPTTTELIENTEEIRKLFKHLNNIERRTDKVENLGNKELDDILKELKNIKIKINKILR